MRRSVLVAGLLTALLLDCPTGVLAKGALPELPAQVRAVLYGRPIPLREVVNHHCHDLDDSVYRCFDTEEERDADMASIELSATTAAVDLTLDGRNEPLGLLSFVYVLIYEHSNYGGNSMAISDPTPNLGAIGWNNAISSFKSTNGGHPKWWSGTSYTGAGWQWVISAWVSYVGDDANDQFSSVKNVP